MLKIDWKKPAPWLVMLHNAMSIHGDTHLVAADWYAIFLDNYADGNLMLGVELSFANFKSMIDRRDAPIECAICMRGDVGRSILCQQCKNHVCFQCCNKMKKDESTLTCPFCRASMI